jgi:uncharacterized protein (DUF302 family)
MTMTDAMKPRTLVLAAALCLTLPAIAAEGMISVPSDFNVSATADRLESVLHQKGMTVFNRIKHSEAAAEVGSPLMACSQTVAIDLPQKALVWEDENGKVWISYNDQDYLKKRHDVSGCDSVLAKIAEALAGISKAAATQ